MPKNLKTLTYEGETLTLNKWAERLGCSRQTLDYRINQGWPVDKVITTPIGSYHRQTKAKAAFQQLARDIDLALRVYANEVGLIE